MHEEATRDGNTVTAARASESAEQLRAAAELLGCSSACPLVHVCELGVALEL
jgi:hypothetical protein